MKLKASSSSGSASPAQPSPIPAPSPELIKLVTFCICWSTLSLLASSDWQSPPVNHRLCSSAFEELMQGPSACSELMPAFPDMGILPLQAKTSPSLPTRPPECPAGLSQCLATFISPMGLVGPFSVQGAIHIDPCPPNSVLGHLTPVGNNFCDTTQCGKSQWHFLHRSGPTCLLLLPCPSPTAMPSCCGQDSRWGCCWGCPGLCGPGVHTPLGSGLEFWVSGEDSRKWHYHCLLITKWCRWKQEKQALSWICTIERN